MSEEGATMYLWLIATPYLLWIFYLAVMNLKRARDAGRLHRVAAWLGLPVLVVGYVLDVLVQVVPATIVFFDPPRELLLTTRLKRYKDRTDWRGKVSAFMADVLLDDFDPSGKHV